MINSDDLAVRLTWVNPHFLPLFSVTSRLTSVNNLVYEKLKDKKARWLNANSGFVESAHGL